MKKIKDTVYNGGSSCDYIQFKEVTERDFIDRVRIQKECYGEESIVVMEDQGAHLKTIHRNGDLSVIYHTEAKVMTVYYSGECTYKLDLEAIDKYRNNYRGDLK